jgi:hypothetical protein
MSKTIVEGLVKACQAVIREMIKLAETEEGRELLRGYGMSDEEIASLTQIKEED